MVERVQVRCINTRCGVGGVNPGRRRGRRRRASLCICANAEQRWQVACPLFKIATMHSDILQSCNKDSSSSPIAYTNKHGDCPLIRMFASLHKTHGRRESSCTHLNYDLLLAQIVRFLCISSRCFDDDVHSNLPIAPELRVQLTSWFEPRPGCDLNVQDCTCFGEGK